VGRKKFLKCDIFNYVQIKNHKKWQSEKQNKIRKGFFVKLYSIRNKNIFSFLELLSLCPVKAM
jgi:hypothetical protein